MSVIPYARAQQCIVVMYDNVFVAYLILLVFQLILLLHYFQALPG